MVAKAFIDALEVTDSTLKGYVTHDARWLPVLRVQDEDIQLFTPYSKQLSLMLLIFFLFLKSSLRKRFAGNRKVKTSAFYEIL